MTQRQGSRPPAGVCPQISLSLVRGGFLLATLRDREETCHVQIKSFQINSSDRRRDRLLGAIGSRHGDGRCGLSSFGYGLEPKGEENGVSITYAYFPRKGTLAIYGSNARGQVGKTRLGQVAIDAGDHRNVKIALSQSPKRGTKLWAVVQQKNGSPFRNQGTPAEQSFKIL
jgi:hypothetical protein